MHVKARTRTSVIREHRRRLHLTQAQLAEQCGVHRSSIAGAESGNRGLGLTDASLLARRFEVPIESLIEYVDELGRPVSDDALVALLDGWKNAPEAVPA